MPQSHPDPARASNRPERAAKSAPPGSSRTARDRAPRAVEHPVALRRMALPSDPRLPWLLTGLLALLLIGAIIWGFGQRDKADTTQANNQTLTRELAQVRAGANATAYTLTPTKDGPASARGTAFYALTGSGMLQIAGLPPLAAGQRYQLWYFPKPDQKPIPGGTFALDAQGIGFMLIPSDVGNFAQIGISREPEKGSQAPTGPMLVTGTVNAARG